MLKQLFSLLVMTTLVACGGGGAELGVDTTSGGDSNSGGGAALGGDSNTGGDSFGGLNHCVSINRPSSNLKYTLEETEYSDGLVISEDTKTFDVLAFGDATSTVKITTLENENILTTRSEFYFADNYQHTTFSFNERKNRIGETILTQAIYFDPYSRFPDGEVCENQPWEDNYIDRRDTIVDGLQEPEQRSTVKIQATIEGINILKTVEAGEFNTYIVKLRNDDTEHFYWIDIESGVEVYSEVRGVGVLVSTSELIDLRY